MDSTDMMVHTGVEATYLHQRLRCKSSNDAPKLSGHPAAVILQRSCTWQVGTKRRSASTRRKRMSEMHQALWLIGCDHSQITDRSNMDLAKRFKGNGHMQDITPRCTSPMLKQNPEQRVERNTKVQADIHDASDHKPVTQNLVDAWNQQGPHQPPARIDDFEIQRETDAVEFKAFCIGATGRNRDINHFEWAPLLHSIVKFAG